jgi:diguanylate cyclase
MTRASRLIPRRPGLAFWIMLGTLGSASITLLLLLILTDNFAAEYAQKRAQGEVHRLANNMANALNLQLGERINDLQLLAHWSMFREQPPEHQRPVLSSLAEESNHYLWLLLASPQGKIRVASLSPLEGIDVYDDPWFPPQFQHPNISDIHAEPIPTITGEKKQLTLQYEIAVPLADRRGLLEGWLIASLPWQNIELLARQLLGEQSAPAQADLLMFKSDGLVFFSSQDPTIRKIPDAMRLLSPDDSATRQQWPDHQWYFTAIQKLAQQGEIQRPDWNILVRQPVSVAMRDFSHLQDQITLSAILAFCALSLLTLVMSHRLTAPLKALRQALENPTTQFIPQSDSYAEVILLSRVLAEMRQLEQQDLQELARLNQTLETQVAVRTQELDNVLQHAMNAFISINEQGKVIDWNLQASRLLGWEKQETLGLPLPEEMLHQEDQSWLQNLLELHAQTRLMPLIQHHQITELCSRQGECIAVEVNVWISETQQSFRLNLIIQDIRKRLAIELALRESQLRLQTITDNLPVLIAYIDRDLRYQFNNATYTLWYQWPVKELQNQPLINLYPGEEYDYFLPFMQQALQGEVQRFERIEQRMDGMHYLFSMYIPHHSDGQVVGFYVLSQDITPRKELEFELQRHAQIDSLTGLPNRRALMEQLPKAMARSVRTTQSMALLFMDLDGFKAVNDNFGHDAGDELLQQFAQRIQSHLRETDTLFRLAGDEFTLILENLSDGEQDSQLKAEQLLNSMHQPFVLSMATVVLSSSIGIACYNHEPEITGDHLLTLSDKAMYQAKRTGKNRFVMATPES